MISETRAIAARRTNTGWGAWLEAARSYSRLVAGVVVSIFGSACGGLYVICKEHQAILAIRHEAVWAGAIEFAWAGCVMCAAFDGLGFKKLREVDPRAAIGAAIGAARTA